MKILSVLSVLFCFFCLSLGLTSGGNVRNVENLLSSLRLGSLELEGELESELQELILRNSVPSYIGSLLSSFQKDPSLTEELLAGVSTGCQEHTLAWIVALLTNFTSPDNTWAVQSKPETNFLPL
jgi:hypothetical protein